MKVAASEERAAIVVEPIRDQIGDAESEEVEAGQELEKRIEPRWVDPIL